MRRRTSNAGTTASPANMPRGQAADDAFTGPAQRGDGEQQIGLVGEPLPGEAAREVWLEADIRQTFLGPGSNDAAARPVCGTGPEVWPGLLTDTDFHRAAMAQDASRPCAG